jgi:hypothetical protein
MKLTQKQKLIIEELTKTQFKVFGAIYVVDLNIEGEAYAQGHPICPGFPTYCPPGNTETRSTGTICPDDNYFTYLFCLS